MTRANFHFASLWFASNSKTKSPTWTFSLVRNHLFLGNRFGAKYRIQHFQNSLTSSIGVGGPGSFASSWSTFWDDFVDFSTLRYFLLREPLEGTICIVWSWGIWRFESEAKKPEIFMDHELVNEPGPPTPILLWLSLVYFSEDVLGWCLLRVLVEVVEDDYR